MKKIFLSYIVLCLLNIANTNAQTISQTEEFNEIYSGSSDDSRSQNYFRFYKTTPNDGDDYPVGGHYLAFDGDLHPTMFENKRLRFNNEYSDINDNITYPANVGFMFTNQQLFTLKSMNFHAEIDGETMAFKGYNGDALVIAAVNVDLMIAGVYGSGATTITVTQYTYNGNNQYSTLTFGSGWTGINAFEIYNLNSNQYVLHLDKIVHEVVCASCANTPISQNFNEVYGGETGELNYSKSYSTFNCMTYAFGVSCFGFHKTLQGNMSGRSLIVSQPSSGIPSGTPFKFYTTDYPTIFKLTEFKMARLLTGNPSSIYKIIGYNNGSAMVTVDGVDLTNGTTYGSGNDAINYNNSTGNGGTLSFGSNWTGIDEVRIYASDGQDLAFELDDIVLEAIICLSTTSASSVTNTTATSGGNVTSDAGSAVTARGVCWSTSANPTIADSKTTDGTGTGSFTSSMTGLTTNTVYNYRSYATNSFGTSYGENKRLITTTSSACPTFTETFDTDNGYTNVGYGIYNRDYFGVEFSNGAGNDSYVNAGVVHSTNYRDVNNGYFDDENQHKFTRSAEFILKTLNVEVVEAPTSGLFLRAFGPSNLFISVEVDLNNNGVYGTGDNTITVSGASNVKTITFGSGWFGVNEFQVYYQTFDAVTLNINSIDFTEGVYAASGPSTILSTATGTWSNNGTWVGGVVPTSADNAQINDTHEVTVRADTSITDLILKNGGGVTVSGTAVLTITGNLQDEGGFFIVESGAQVIVMGNVTNSSAASKLVNTSTNGLLIKGNVDVGQ
jgi:hypothetical protein